MGWPTTDEVIEFYGLSQDYYDQMDVSGPWVQSLIETYLGRKLLETSYTQDSYMPQTGQIQLDNYPIVSIDKVTMDGEEKDLTDYVLMKRTGQVYGDFTTVEMLEIEYTGGFSELPDIITAVYMSIMKDGYDELSGVSDNDVKDVTLFDFAKVSYDTSSASSGSSISYSGVGGGSIPEPLSGYLGMLDLYKSNIVLLGSDGVG